MENTSWISSPASKDTSDSESMGKDFRAVTFRNNEIKHIFFGFRTSKRTRPKVSTTVLQWSGMDAPSHSSTLLAAPQPQSSQRPLTKKIGDFGARIKVFSELENQWVWFFEVWFA